MKKPIKIAIAEDEHLIREAFADLINGFENCQVIIEAENGKKLSESIEKNNIPDIAIVDIKMPEWDGYKTVQWLKNEHPTVKVIVLSMYDDDVSIIKMLNLDIKGYLPKGIRKAELLKAIQTVDKGELFFSGAIMKRMISINTQTNVNHFKELNPQLIQFLELCCTSMTYTEIAKEMYRGEDAIDKYRSKLFIMFNVKNRTAMVIYAILNNIISIERISNYKTLHCGGDKK